MSNKKGMIIGFDGPDGAGKSTQLNLAADSLARDGYKVHKARAIGGLPLTDILYDALVLKAERPPQTDLHIAMASQFALAKEVIKRRDAGEIVLIDRTPLSIIAFQVYADGMDKQVGYSAAKELLDEINYDLIIIYSLDISIAETRFKQRNGDANTDYFESKPREYHLKTAEGYAQAAQDFGAKIIDAGAPIELVREATMDAIGSLLQA